MKGFIILFLFVVQVWPTLAQKLNFPADSAKAIKTPEKYALFSDHFRNGEFEQALGPLEWLMANAPAIHEYIYVNGVKILDSLQEAEPLPAEKLRLQEKVMRLYDLRMSHFNGKEAVLNRKALMAYRYFKDDEEKTSFLLDLFDDAFRSDPGHIFSGMPLAYMDVVRRYQQRWHALSKEDILERTTG